MPVFSRVDGNRITRPNVQGKGDCFGAHEALRQAWKSISRAEISRTEINN